MKGNAEHKSGLCSFLMLNKPAINQLFPSASKSRFTEWTCAVLLQSCPTASCHSDSVTAQMGMTEKQ